jgi:hypothetical protein
MSDLAPEDALNGPPVDTPPISQPTNGWRFPPEMEASWRSRRWPRRHWRPLLAIGLGLVAVVALAIPASFLLRVEIDLVNRSGGRITSVNLVTINGRTTFDIHAAPGISQSAGLDLACAVVGPVLARDGYGDATFFLLDRAGDVLATQSSACATPTPSPSVNPVT